MSTIWGVGQAAQLAHGEPLRFLFGLAGLGPPATFGPFVTRGAPPAVSPSARRPSSPLWVRTTPPPTRRRASAWPPRPCRVVKLLHLGRPRPRSACARPATMTGLGCTISWRLAHKLDGLLGSLAEAGPGSTQMRGDRRRPLPRQRPHRAVIAHFSHHVLVNRVVLHGSGLAQLHVHDHAAAAAAAHRLHAWRDRESRHVVDDGSARHAGRGRHLGMACPPTRRRRPPPGPRRYPRCDPLIGRDRRGARTRSPPTSTMAAPARTISRQMSHSPPSDRDTPRRRRRNRGHVQNTHDDGRAGVEVVLSGNARS